MRRTRTWERSDFDTEVKVGHLFEAEDESRECPDLHNAIRQARKTYQADGTMPDWEKLATRANDQRIALATDGGAERGNG